jgi:hypothetical protein
MPLTRVQPGLLEATGTASSSTFLRGDGAWATTITSGTAVSASGTSVIFTGIPSTAKRITVLFRGLSTNGTSNYVVRIGNTTITATGYTSTMTYTNISSNSSVGTTDTTGYILTRDTGASLSFTGALTIYLLTNVGNFTYVATFNAIGGSGGPTYQGSGFVGLLSVLDRVSITTLNGTDTFDTGDINVMWE